MNNHEIAQVFEDIGGLMELKGEDRFKIQAYQRAARAIDLHPVPLEKLAAEGRLASVPGVGKAISEKITELLTTGEMRFYDSLRAEFPATLVAVMDISGVGPKLAGRFWKELGVQSIADLEAAIQDGRLAAMPKLGAKSAENIQRSIASLRQRDERLPIAQALALADLLCDAVLAATPASEVVAAGSVRRFRDTIGDFDLACAAADPEVVVEAFLALPVVSEVLRRGKNGANVRLQSGMDLDLRVVHPDTFGSLLQHFTGSMEHNIALRERARRMGLSVSEYGITDLATGVLTPCRTEEEVYQRLGLPYIPPEVRETGEEIERAAAGTLPQFITLEDIQGNLHTHTVASDGAATLEQMVAAAMERGYRYLAITDHSMSLGVASGLSPERLREHLVHIRALNEELDGRFHILTGSEVDIKSDGTMDYPDEILAGLDVVIASIHSAMGQDEETMTARVIRALRNPHVDILGHPTARMLGRRNPVKLDMERVFEVALETGTALEMNVALPRLDLKDVYIRRAVELGVPMVISSDAHSTSELDRMPRGISQARRGWTEARHVLNTRPLPELLSWLRRND